PGHRQLRFGTAFNRSAGSAPLSALFSTAGSVRLAFTRRAPRSPLRRNRHVVLHIADRRNHPGDLPNVTLQALVVHAASERYAPIFATHLYFARPREQFERVVDEVLALLVAGGAHRLAAPDGDGSEQCGNAVGGHQLLVDVGRKRGRRAERSRSKRQTRT